MAASPQISIRQTARQTILFCSFSTSDAERSRWQRHFKITGTADKKEVAQVCRTWTQAAQAGRNGRLTADTARESIARGVADVFSAANRESLPSRSVRGVAGGIAGHPDSLCRNGFAVHRLRAADVALDAGGRGPRA